MSDDTEEEAIYRRLDDLTITGVAGVDFPAHLHDGWAVMKAASGSQRQGEDRMSVVDEAAFEQELGEFVDVLDQPSTVALARLLIGKMGPASDPTPAVSGGAVSKSATPSDPPAPVPPSVSAIPDRLLEMAAVHAKETGLRPAVAYGAVVESEEGRALYDRYDTATMVSAPRFSTWDGSEATAKAVAVHKERGHLESIVKVLGARGLDQWLSSPEGRSWYQTTQEDGQ